MADKRQDIRKEMMNTMFDLLSEVEKTRCQYQKAVNELYRIGIFDEVLKTRMLKIFADKASDFEDDEELDEEELLRRNDPRYFTD